MNRKQIILISAIFGISALAPAAFAEEKVPMQASIDARGVSIAEMPASESGIEGIESKTMQQAPASLSKDTLLGKNIFNDTGSDLGKVVDVFVDKDTNKIAYLIIKSGGVLGVGSKERAVPFPAVKQDAEGSLTLSMSDSSFNNAPEKAMNMEDREWGLKVHDFFGVSPYWETTEESPAQNIELEEEQYEE